MWRKIVTSSVHRHSTPACPLGAQVVLALGGQLAPSNGEDDRFFLQKVLPSLCHGVEQRLPRLLHLDCLQNLRQSVADDCMVRGRDFAVRCRNRLGQILKNHRPQQFVLQVRVADKDRVQNTRLDLELLKVR